MNTDETNRLIEIRFYHLIIAYYNMRNNLEDVLSIIDLMSWFAEFNSLLIKELATNLLVNPAYKPTPTESLVLYYKAGFNIRRTIDKVVKFNHKRMYKVLEEYGQDPYPFPTKYTQEEREQVDLFLHIVEKFSDIGGSY